ncbi:hypothetical protein [Cupriavidus pinatubonensis]|uniref:hypothetical protein n=1 Tax=Cupriavidus pinatubonensis TaxID=248026 RepID=UPI00112AB457|nr:hypothetical protein [Cupriavidus pinatubonensis]
MKPKRESLSAEETPLNANLKMVNKYFDETGLLALKTVTPVIRALFQDFYLDPSRPSKGRAYIARSSESNVPQWEDIHENLRELVLQLGLSVSNGDTIENRLNVLATHFGADGDATLATLIDLAPFDGRVEPGVLFEIARRLDDGHGLKAMNIEGGWQRSNGRLLEYGGYGEYYGRHVSVSESSSTALNLGKKLDVALEAGDLGKAIEGLLTHIRSLLAGVTNDETRAALRTGIAKGLLGPADTERVRAVISLDGGIIEE